MISFIIQAIRIGMSFLFGSTGETITEKSGNLNLGIPGIMCVGAASGCVAVAKYTEAVGGIEFVRPYVVVPLAIVASFVGGALLGLIYAFLTVTLRANQNVTGLALTTLGSGISDYMIAKVNSSLCSLNSKFFTTLFPFADKLGVPGKLLFSYGTLVYLAIIVAFLSAYVLSHTRVGLNLRSVGENPATADAAGINVARYKYLATLVGSGIAGVGGLCYIMDNLNGNWEYSIDAIGWLAIALVIFTLWKPNLGVIGSIIFGALYICPSYISGIGFDLKAIIQMLPYIVTIIVLVVVSMRKKREHQPPQSLGLAYFREDR